MVKRVTIGFLSIVVLLLVAGMISFFELAHLGNDVEKLVNENRRSMESAKEMLDAVHDHSTAVVHIVTLGRDANHDTLCVRSLAKLENTLASLAGKTKDDPKIDTLATTVARFHVMTEVLLSSNIAAPALDKLVETEAFMEFVGDYEDESSPASYIGWYADQYTKLRNELSNNINSYIDSAFNGLTPRTQTLSNNAHRAVTPVLISLLVMIAIVLMLFYFIMIYFVLPIKKIDQALVDWMTLQKSFNVKAECRDELIRLRENIGGLIDRLEKKDN